MVERILELARGELGTREFPPGSNNVKYNTAYYNREVSGPSLAWCAVFIWWLFKELGHTELYFDGKKTAYVPALVDWGRRSGLIVDTPEPGDLVTFDFDANGAANHIGICTAYDGRRVTTIDGNTGVGNDANGGAVMERTRDKKYILAVIRPRYESEDDMDISKMTDEQILELAQRISSVLAVQPPSGWSDEAREWAEKNGYINGDENGRMQYKKFCTREELIQILYNKEH